MVRVAFCWTGATPDWLWFAGGVGVGFELQPVVIHRHAASAAERVAVKIVFIV
jgi:hypothetical protein